MEILDSLYHLFYPRNCPGCGQVAIEKGEYICIQCFHNLPFTQFEKLRENQVEKAFYGRVKIEAATSLLYFTRNSIVQNLMHELKYNKQKELGIFLGRIMGIKMRESNSFPDCDLIIPVPLHPEKEKIRGFNQSDQLCKGISQTTGWPFQSGTVTRNIQTTSQTRKHRKERWQNVAAIFGVQNPEFLNNRHILLVDDVVTTGSTLESCAATILENTNARLSIATLAVATK